nr:metallophosphoesterase family protein [Rhizobium sp. AQ_MP]
MRKSAPALKRDRLVLDPDFSCIYAIGDIHGCQDELQKLENKIMVDGRELSGPKLVVMLGDYVDRGPSSASVIEHLLKPLPADFCRICLLGNHDQMFLDFWNSPSPAGQWLGLGGDETLASYGIYLDDAKRHPLASQARAMIPQEHVDFLEALPVMLRVGSYCFVHAGIDPALAIDNQVDDVLLTSRPYQFDWNAYGGDMTIVHGHTPIKEIDVTARHINLDLKVYESGRLAALRILPNRLDVLFSD